MAIEKRMTKRQAVALAKKFGAVLEVSNEHPFEIEAIAPRGHHWVCDPGVHALVSSVWDDETEADMWDDIAKRMDSGVEKCFEDCEYWNE